MFSLAISPINKVNQLLFSEINQHLRTSVSIIQRNSCSTVHCLGDDVFVAFREITILIHFRDNSPDSTGRDPLVKGRGL